VHDKEFDELNDTHARLQHDIDAGLLSGLAGQSLASLRDAEAELAVLRSRVKNIQSTLRDPLWVVLLGRFSAGKSSLINALLRAGGEERELRATGLPPTDLQVTLVLHSAARSGLLSTSATSAVVDGLSVAVQPHEAERINSLILVDTPGLDEQHEIDDALMEFIANADVILHCMTPDFELSIPDQRLLDKRKKYFPSQLYHIVVTKGDLHLSEDPELWPAHGEDLRTRLATTNRSNPSIAGDVSRSQVSVVDSESDKNIEPLLAELIHLANDRSSEVPRVREPVVRDRIRYIADLTLSEVVGPLVKILTKAKEGASAAEDLLVDEESSWDENISKTGRKVVQLTLAGIVREELPQDLAGEMGSVLDLARVFGREQDESSAVLAQLLQVSQQELRDTVLSWRAAFEKHSSLAPLTARHAQHKEHFDHARSHLRAHALPAYSAWFGTSFFGRKLRGLLSFSDVAELLLDSETFAKPVVTGQSSDSDAEAAGSPSGRERIPIDQEHILAALADTFREGTDDILTQANTNASNSIGTLLRARVAKYLDERTSHFATFEADIERNRIVPGSKVCASIKEALQEALVPNVNQSFGALRQTVDGIHDRVRHHMAVHGLNVELEAAGSTSWDEERRRASDQVRQLVDELFADKCKADANGLVKEISADLSSMSDDLLGLKAALGEKLAVELTDLQTSQRGLNLSIENRTGAFRASIDVFASIEGVRNFFDEHGIGGEMDTDLNAGLGVVFTQLKSRRQLLITQLVGSAALSSVLIASIAVLSFGTVTVPNGYTGLVNGVVLAILGAAVAGVISAVWKLIAFPEYGRREVVRTAETQIQSVCQHSSRNLANIEKEEERAYGTVKATKQVLIDDLAHNGVQALGELLLNQLEDRVVRIGDKISMRHSECLRRLNSLLRTFTEGIKAHGHATAEACAKQLHDTASSAMGREITRSREALERVGIEAERCLCRLEVQRHRGEGGA